MIDQYLPHHLSGHSKKMRTVLPLQRTPFGNAKVRLVNERSRLQSVIRTLAQQTLAGNTPELLVHQRNQGIARSYVPLAPAGKKVGDGIGRVRRHRFGREAEASSLGN